MKAAGFLSGKRYHRTVLQPFITKLSAFCGRFLSIQVAELLVHPGQTIIRRVFPESVNVRNK